MMWRITCLALFLSTVCQAQEKTMEGTSRMATGLLKKLEGRHDSLTVSVSFRLSLPGMQVKDLFHLPGSVNKGDLIVARLSAADIKRLAQDPRVIFISEVLEPREELTTGAYDLTLNGISYLQHTIPGLSGNSLQANIKERLFDSTDIDLAGRVFRTGLETNQVTAHASLMTTIIAGSANSSPFARGVAPEALVSSSSFLHLFPDPDSVFQRYAISLQNHSYGTQVENFYGNEASAYDRQANSLPFLLHVFSAGNSGNLTPDAGTYAGVAQAANLTGNFKQAKNIITVGSLDSAGRLMPLSSKGPAYDGRIKPELMAYGEDGSSGAAALVSGTVLLMQEIYKNGHGGQLPSSALVRAALLNSATDVGNPGIDYASGFGNLDAFGAVTTVLGGRFLEDSVLPGETKTYKIELPAGLSRVKITLTWNDPAAQPNSPKALVNDLDMQLQLAATGASWDPWVLDPGANTAALESLPQRKKDTLNNVEQITVEHPASGQYTIQVTASVVRNATQDFAITWQTDTTGDFRWIYPHGDALIAGNTHWLRWQTNSSGQGQIEYATSGSNWRPVGPPVDLAQGYYRWTIPDTLTTAVLRMRALSSNRTVISDTFTVSPQLKVDVGFNCPDSFLLYWKHLPLNTYRLYELEGRYLRAFTETGDTAVILHPGQHSSFYYAVAPIINGREGIRSYTVNYAARGACYIRSFYLQGQANNTAVFTAELGSLFGVADLSLERIVPGGAVPVQTVSQPSVLLFSFTDSLMTQGENRYRLKLRLANGTVIYSQTEIIFNLPADPVVLYPDPVPQNSQLTVLTAESGRYILYLWDINGRLLHQQELNSSLVKIDTGRLGKGLYLVRIRDRQGRSFTKKLIVY